MATVLVTGCSSGIGRALVDELAGRGHEVIATARRLDTIGDAPAHKRLQLDVTSADSVVAAVALAGPIDVLVNNAGITLWGPVELLPIDDVTAVFETNVLGALRMMQAVLPQMRARRQGRIVCVSTPAALRGDPLISCYGSSKAALERLCESLRLEIGHLGIDVLLAEPGGVESNFAANRKHVPVADADYVDLVERNGRLSASYAAGRITSEAAATEIADLVERPHPPLRTPIGSHAATLVHERRSLDDEQRLRSMQEQLGLVDPDRA